MSKRRRLRGVAGTPTPREETVLEAGICPDCGLPLDLPDRPCETCHHSIREHIPVALEAGVAESIRFQCGNCCENCPIPSDLHAQMDPTGLLKRTPTELLEEAGFLVELSSLGMEFVELGQAMTDRQRVLTDFPWNRLREAGKRFERVEEILRPVMGREFGGVGEALQERVEEWLQDPESNLLDIQASGENLITYGGHMYLTAQGKLSRFTRSPEAQDTPI